MSEKRGRALVGRHHQVGVVRVMAHHAGRRHHRALDQVVGHVQQAREEQPVAGHALGHEGLALAGGRRVLQHEAAFGADRHDHRVLDLLGLHQAQHLRCGSPRGGQTSAGRRAPPCRRADARLRHAANRPRFRTAAWARARQGLARVELEATGRACLRRWRCVARRWCAGWRLMVAKNWRRMRSSSRLATAARWASICVAQLLLGLVPRCQAGPGRSGH